MTEQELANQLAESIINTATALAEQIIERAKINSITIEIAASRIVERNCSTPPEWEIYKAQQAAKNAPPQSDGCPSPPGESE